MHAGVQPQAAVPTGATVPASTSPDAKREKYKMTLFGLGVSEVVMGVLFVVLGAANIGVLHSLGRYYYYRFYFNYLLISPSIWCGVLLIASGAVGIHAKKNSSYVIYNANMGLSIVAAIAMLVLFVMSIISCVLVPYASLSAIHALLAIGSFAALVVSIVHSAYCCVGTCCTTSSHQGQVLYFPTQAHPGQQQYVQLANGQYALLQTQAPAGYPVVALAPGSVTGQPSYVYPMTQVQQPVASVEIPQVVPNTSVEMQKPTFEQQQYAPQPQEEAPPYSAIGTTFE